MSGYLLDTVVFNRLVDEGVSPDSLRGKGLMYVTHIQANELQATRNPARAAQLLAMFRAVEREQVPTAAAVWDVSEWNEAEFGDANGLYGLMLESLNRRNGGKANNVQDVRIAVTAHKRGLVLVTEDYHLAMTLREYGGQAMRFQEFLTAGAPPPPEGSTGAAEL